MDTVLIWIEDNRYLAIAILTGIFLLIAILLGILRKKKPDTIDVDVILSALGKGNIQAVRFVRNKINVEVRDVKRTDMEMLKSSGAVGINLVGNKIKFYYEEANEKVYESLLQVFEERA